MFADRIPSATSTAREPLHEVCTPHVGNSSTFDPPGVTKKITPFSKAPQLQYDGDMRTAGLSVLFGLSITTVACTTGDTGTGGVTQGIQCSAALIVTGTFVQGEARPVTNPNNCWPIGMWTFTAALDTSMPTACSPAPVPLPQYQFSGTTVLDPQTGDELQVFTYLTDPTINNIAKANQGGVGSCEGDLSLYSADGKQVWSLKPEMFLDNTISGLGEFRVYDKDQWLGP